MYRYLMGAAIAIVIISTASAGSITPRDGWVVIDTSQSFATLTEQLESAVKTEEMALVTSASASAGAKAAGITIPGNHVIGVFRNDFARRMLSASVSSGIEAPIRFYVTENSDGTTTLSYKKPSFVLEPYYAEGKEPLKALGVDLDKIFAKIAERAIAVK